MRTPLILSALSILVACNNSHSLGDAGADAEIERDAGADAGRCGRVPETHRSAAEMCDDERPYGEIEIDDTGVSTCTTHEECTAGRNGRCIGNSFHGFHCTYDACLSDSECGEGPCACGGGRTGDANRCLQGNCQVDSDCGPGGFCSPSLGSCGDYGGVVGYFCHSCEDECVEDSDCPDDPAGGLAQRGYCAFEPEVGHWRCSTRACAG